MRVWPLATTVVLLLAGCVQSESTEQGSLPGSIQSDTDPGATSAWGLVGFSSAAFINETHWLNGSFQPADPCNPIGCATGSAIRRIDITDYLPPNMPVRLRANLNYSTDQPVFAQPIIMVLLAPVGSTYTRIDNIETPGRIQIDATLIRRDQPIDLEVVYVAPASAETTIHYELNVETWAHPHLIPGGVPILVDAEPGTRLRAETPAGHPVKASVYGSQDLFLGRFPTDGTGEILDGNTVGEHVLVFPESIAWIQLNATNLTKPLKALDLVRIYSTPQPVAGSQPIAWSAPVDKTPLQVGVFETNITMMLLAIENAQATISGPDGHIAQGPLGCSRICIQGGNHFTILRSETGDPRHAAGEYDFHYEPATGVGVQIGHFVTHYHR